MIRDPSDGSVRPAKSAPALSTPHNTGERLPIGDDGRAGADTGLPSFEKDRAAKLEKSRAWLKDYYERRAQCGDANASSASSND